MTSCHQMMKLTFAVLPITNVFLIGTVGKQILILSEAINDNIIIALSETPPHVVYTTSDFMKLYNLYSKHTLG